MPARAPRRGLSAPSRRAAARRRGPVRRTDPERSLRRPTAPWDRLGTTRGTTALSGQLIARFLGISHRADESDQPRALAHPLLMPPPTKRIALGDEARSAIP